MAVEWGWSMSGGRPGCPQQGVVIVHTFEIGKSFDPCNHLARLEQTHMQPLHTISSLPSERAATMISSGSSESFA